MRNDCSGEDPLDDALQRLAETAARAIPEVDAVTLAVRPHAAGVTDARLIEIDESNTSPTEVHTSMLLAHCLLSVR